MAADNATKSNAAGEPASAAGSAKPTTAPKLETATFGEGCFWCSEAVYQRLRGVKSVVSGYSGGNVDKPTYEQVCTGRTGHAEVIQVTFDPSEISYDDLLKVFWQTHDPTTLNQQGHDTGTQYRSAVFYENEDQKDVAEAYIKQLTAAKVFDKPIAVTVEDMPHGFFPAEEYHQEFVKKNPNQPYVRSCSLPKMKNARDLFKDWLKKE